MANNKSYIDRVHTLGQHALPNTMWIASDGSIKMEWPLKRGRQPRTRGSVPQVCY